MGQKVHPEGFRLGINKWWHAKWFSEKDYTKNLLEDFRIRRYLDKRLARSSVAKIEIERLANQIKVNIYTAKPALIIGKRGAEVENVRKDIEKMTTKNIVRVDIMEIREPELTAQLVAENIASQLERRVSSRRAMKQAINSAMRSGAKGVKVATKGRIGGGEIARKEWYPAGRMPLHTIRADIDYGFSEANTIFGKIGVKVWVFRDEILKENTRDVNAVAGKV